MQLELQGFIIITLVIIGWTSPRFAPDVGFAPCASTHTGQPAEPGDSSKGTARRPLGNQTGLIQNSRLLAGLIATRPVAGHSRRRRSRLILPPEGLRSGLKGVSTAGLGPNRFTSGAPPWFVRSSRRSAVRLNTGSCRGGPRPTAARSLQCSGGRPRPGDGSRDAF